MGCLQIRQLFLIFLTDRSQLLPQGLCLPLSAVLLCLQLGGHLPADCLQPVLIRLSGGGHLVIRFFQGTVHGPPVLFPGLLQLPGGGLPFLIQDPLVGLFGLLQVFGRGITGRFQPGVQLSSDSLHLPAVLLPDPCQLLLQGR